jgi:predicted glycoside hydrolase/deacetylase ChbG (UPF0249 family)
MNAALPSVIINGDDLGYSKTVNESVFDLMSQRKISSATIIPNGPCVEDAVERSKSFPWCSFGVHLCLTEFEPLTAAGASLPFVGKDGRFDESSFSCSRPDGHVKRNVYEEWCGQIRYLQSLGLPISHIDSHNHVHTRPWLFFVLKSVQRTFQVKKVRISMNLYYNREHNPSYFLLLKKKAFNLALRRYYPTRTTETFTNLRWLKLILDRRPLKLNNVELMTHPGKEASVQETNLLTSEWFERFTKSYRIISYNEL